MAKNKVEKKEKDQVAVVDAESPSGNRDEETVDEVIIGKVIWFSKAKKGYGFAAMEGEEEGDNDVFVHRKQFAEGAEITDLNPGDTISFILVDPPSDSSNKKPIAGEIKLIERAKEEDNSTKETSKEVKERYENKQKTGDTSG